MKRFLDNNVLRSLALLISFLFFYELSAQENTLKLVPEIPTASFGDRQSLLENGKVNMAFGDYTKFLKLLNCRTSGISSNEDWLYSLVILR